MSIYHLIIISTSAVGLLCLGLTLASQDLEEISAKLLDASRPSMQPSLTLQLLKRLGENYFKQNSKDSIHAAEQIQGLIRAWQIEEQECKRDQWLSLNRKIASYSGNVGRYLQFCRENFFLVCQEAQARNLSTASLQLSDKENNNLNILKDSVIENDLRWSRQGSSYALYLRYSQISLSATMKGLLTFVQTIGPLEAYERDREYFEKVIDQLVRFPCDKVAIHISPKVDDIYRLFSELGDKNNDLAERFDQPTLNWIANNKVCSAIRNDWDDLVDDTYGALREKYRDDLEKKAAWERSQQELTSNQIAGEGSGLFGYLGSVVNYLTSMFQKIK